MDLMRTQVEEFEAHGYTLLKNGLSEDLIRYLANGVKVIPTITDETPITPVKEGYPKDAYGHVFTDLLLPVVQEKLEKVSQKKLIPTYSFLRIYGNGNQLVEHLDRPSCEYSATLTVSNDTKHIWPFYVKPVTSDVETQILADVGDLIVYKGVEVRHWREPLKNSKKIIQIFLHFVDENGMYVDYAYDKRVESVLNAKAINHLSKNLTYTYS